MIGGELTLVQGIASQRESSVEVGGQANLPSGVTTRRTGLLGQPGVGPGHPGDRGNVRSVRAGHQAKLERFDPVDHPIPLRHDSGILNRGERC